MRGSSGAASVAVAAGVGEAVAKNHGVSACAVVVAVASGVAVAI